MNTLLPSAFIIDSLSVYQNIRKDNVVSKLYQCLTLLYAPSSAEQQLKAVSSYTEMCNALYESEYQGSFADYLFSLVLYDDNVFSRACTSGRFHQLPEEIRQAAQQDLDAICALNRITPLDIKNEFKQKFINMPELIDLLPSFSNKNKRFTPVGKWGGNIDSFISFYKNNGIGMYAKFKAFRFDRDKGIEPIRHFDPITLHDLKQYDVQRKKIVENTIGFVSGHPYNNVLLYGDRGTGKSSTVKALLNEFGGRGLRIIEINKQNLIFLDKLIQAIADIPLKFILFIDDLTFQETDENFNVLKALLEGSLSIRPKNVAVYATSNRRHLIKETFSAREGNEVHRADTIDENMSLSDRFGLLVTFTKPNRDAFLLIVKQLAQDRKLEVDSEVIAAGAERFALAKGGRTPRIAKQFIDNLEARVKLKLDIN